MYRKALLLVVALISELISSPAQDFKWVKTYETSGYSAGINSIAVDRFGSVYHSGIFIGTITVGGLALTSPDNNYDGYLVKYDKDGNFLWVKHLTGVANQHVFDVVIRDDDHLLIVGSFQRELSLDGYTLTTAPGSFDFGDSYIAQLDFDGHVVAAKNIGKTETNLADMAGALAVDKWGNVLVCGGEGQRLFVMKLSPLLNVTWRRTYGFTTQVGTIYAHAVVVDDSGEAYVAGASNTSGYLLKYNASGTLLWDKSFNGIIRDMDIDGSGNLIIGGRLTDTSLGETSFGSGGVIGKMNSAGNFVWHMQTDGLEIHHVSVNAWDNNIYFTSTITADVTLGKVSVAVENGRDGLLGVMDGSGRMKWIAKVGHMDAQVGDVLQTDDDGLVYIGNQLPNDREGVFQCQSITGQSQRDLYVAKIKPITSVPINGPLELCEGDTGYFSFTRVSDFIEYQWDLEPDIQWDEVNAETIRITTSEPGAYEITIATPVDLGCAEFLVYHSTTLNVIDVLKKSSISGPAEVCQGAVGVTYLVARSDDVHFVWTPPIGTIVDFASQDKLVITFAEDYSGGEVQYSAVGLCNTVEYDPILVKPLHMPQAPGHIEGESTPCHGVMEEYSFPETNNAEIYTWFMEKNHESAQIAGDGLILQQAFEESIDNALLFVRSSNECGSVDSEPFSIEIMHRPATPDIVNGPEVACALSDVSVSVNPSGAASYHWMVTDNSSEILLFEEFNSNVTLPWQFAGPVTIEVRTVNECGESDPATHQIVEFTDPFVLPEIERNCLQLSYRSDRELMWYRDGKLLGAENQISIKTSGEYELRYHGLCDAQSLFIEIPEDELTEFIPNVFTPNGDEKNQYFEVSKAVEGSPLSIFNRWGKLVYLSQSYSNNWDGENLPSGVYYYTLRSRCSGEVYKGALTLMR